MRIGKWKLYLTWTTIGFYDYTDKTRRTYIFFNWYRLYLGMMAKFWFTVAAFLIWWDKHIWRLKR